MSTPFSASKREIFHAGRIKRFPSGAWELLVCNRPIFREPGWELRGDDLPLAALDAERSDADSAEEAAALAAAEPSEAGAQSAQRYDQNAERAARRAAARVRDLSLSNDFVWFVTLTLDASKVDRYDPKEITRKLNVWLDHQVRRRGLRYVLVAERHKDGAIHFHGMINEVPGLVPSGTWKVPGHKKPMKPRSEAQRREWATQGAEAGYHEVFNWEAWPLGFTTAIRLYGRYDAAVAYVCKYIRKQIGGGKIGGRWYYSGGELREPAVELVDLGLQELYTHPDLYRFEIPEAGLQLGILRGNSEDFETILQKPDCKFGEKSEAGAGGADPEPAENGVQNPRERSDSNSDGLPFGETGGASSFGAHAGKSACRSREFTHGAPDFGCFEPQNGAAQARFLDHGEQDGEAAARGLARAAAGRPAQAGRENLRFRASDRPEQAPDAANRVARHQAGGGAVPPAPERGGA